jgi:hypothetical protein
LQILKDETKGPDDFGQKIIAIIEEWNFFEADENQQVY